MKKKPFCFFKIWCHSSRFENIVQQGWQREVQGSKIFQVVRKLKLMKTDLKLLNKEEFGDVSVQNSVMTYQQMIESQAYLQADPNNFEVREQEQQHREAYGEAYSHYLSLLSQKAKVKWVEEEDDNTKVFYQSI